MSKKYKVSFLVLFVILLGASFAFPKISLASWTERTSAGSRPWTSIASSSDGTKLAAATGNGYVYTSINSGADWTERTNSGIHGWTSIASSSDGTKLAATVIGGYVYTSINSGADWTERTSAGFRSWKSIASSSDGTKLAATVSGGYVYTSINSGADWTERTNSGMRSWGSIASSSDGTKLAATVNGGYVYTSINSGADWTERTNSGMRSWGSIASSSDGTKLAAVAFEFGGGYVYTSINSGADWTERTSTGLRSWMSIASSSDGTKLAAVSTNDGFPSGYIYTSINSGADWTEQTSANSRSWGFIASSSDGTKLAATVSGGYIYTSISNVAPVATGVSFSGTAKINQLQTGTYTYSDTDGDLQGSSTFRWLRDGSPINGATSSTYTTVLADVGHTLSFEVTPVALTGTTPGTPVVSAGTTILNSAPLVKNVTFSGTTKINQLQTGYYDYSDADGDAQGVLTFRWLRDGIAIGSATSPTYTTVLADVGHTLTFEVTPVALTGILTGIPVVSTGRAITNSSPIASSVSFTGIAKINQLQTGTYTYFDADGDTQGITTFRWLRNGSPIALATASTYTTVLADVGTTLSFEVTPVALTGTTPGTPVASSGTAILNSLPIVSNLSITGSSSVGSLLTGHYTYSDIDSDAEGTSTFRWLRNDVAITNATSSTYTTTNDDIGTTIKFEVTPVALTGATSGTALTVTYDQNIVAVSQSGGGGGSTYRPPVIHSVTPPVIIPPTTNSIGSSHATARTLRQGMRGSDILTLQTYLYKHQYGLTKKDLISYFGAKTKQAVIAFQKKHKLKADGVVGEKTSALLK
jgi:hypothetical protein